jgi:hypothetical protein
MKLMTVKMQIVEEYYTEDGGDIVTLLMFSA